MTGGGGFLGQAICTQLLEHGYAVRSFSRSHYAALDAMGVEQVHGDLGSYDDVLRATQGVDAVIHNAALAGAWGPYDDYYRTNVVGTDHVIRAARAAGVRRLVYTSTPSVTHRATHPVAGLDASQVAYGEHLKAPYAATKKIAEIHALQANDAELAVTALRPRLIWGVGDNHILPGLIARARSGKLRLVGDGNNLIDSTYVDNAAFAHIQALKALDVGSANAGKAYFISNGDPRSLKETMNRMLEAAGAPLITRSVPFGLAMTVAQVSEWAYRLLPLPGEPMLTPFLVEQLVTTHWYDMTPAREDFGYIPPVSFDEGMRRLARELASQAS